MADDTKKTTKKTTAKKEATTEATESSEPRKGGESVFVSTIANHRIGGCQFVRGSYTTSDPAEIKRIRESGQFGQTVSEVGSAELAEAKA